MSTGIVLLASSIFLFPLWLILRALKTSRQLNKRLAAGDITLLTDDRFTIDRVTLGPPGTEFIENVQFVASSQAPINQQGGMQYP